MGAAWEDSTGNTIINAEGALGDNDTVSSGAVYIYKRKNHKRVQEAFIKSSNSNAGDRFGERALAISGDTAVISSPGEQSNQTTITNGTTSSTDNSITSNAGAVYVYKRTGSSWQQEAYIKPGNPGIDYYFGRSVDISGDLLVVGQHMDPSGDTTIINGTGSIASSSGGGGSAYVYRRNGSTWQQEAYLKASNTGSGDAFGENVGVSGDTIVVSAYWDDNGLTTILNGPGTPTEPSTVNNAGSAFVFKKTGGLWAQEAYLKASNANAGHAFGRSAVIAGDTIAIGAMQENSNQSTITNGSTASSDTSISEAGAVYVFKRTGANWAQEAYIKSPKPEVRDWFGDFTEISGNTLVVFSWREDSNQTTITNGTGFSSDASAISAGASYVYKRTGNNWVQEAYLKASNATASFRLGQVSISGDTIAVGSWGDETSQSTITNGVTSVNDSSLFAAGAVLVFKNMSRMFEPSDIQITGSAGTINFKWDAKLGSRKAVKIVYASGSTPPANCGLGNIFYEGSQKSASLGGFSAGTYSFRVCTSDGGSAYTQGLTFSNWEL